jgi:NAD(P)-dependent dehydrogenase (short-subunit alcohol dehydrogenase family)
MDRLKNKRALVTGGTTGSELETARQFLQEGARVAITGHSPETLETVRKELGDVLAIHADAGDVAAQKAIADAIRREWDGLDVAFFNAGIGDLRPLEQWDEAGFERSVAVNLKGPFFLVRALLPIRANPLRSSSTAQLTRISVCPPHPSMR